MNSLIRNTYLFFKEGSSDKEYDLYIYKRSDGYHVEANYGRRGNVNRFNDKGTYSNLPAAVNVYNEILREKLSKGYKEESDDLIASHAPIINGAISSGLFPHLLNPITIEQAEYYINDNYFWAQEKLDGKRIIVRVNKGIVEASNRKGVICDIAQEIIDELALLPNCVLDGEYIGNKYYVFDLIDLHQATLKLISYSSRYIELKNLIEKDRILKYIQLVPVACTQSEKRKLMEDLAAKEGIVFKHKDSFYTPGKEHKTQFKCKFWESASVKVIDVNAKRSVAVAIKSGYGFISVGNVTIPPNHDIPEIGDIVEVKYLHYFKNGSLYQPIYLGKRDDVEPDSVESLKVKFEED